MKPVFISYSSADRELVNQLRDDLQALGVNIWIDQTGLKAGTGNWKQALREALRDAGAVLLAASPNSRQSVPVQGELAIAKMYGRPMFPVWVAGEEWADSVPIDMIVAQYIDARGDAYTAAIPRIVDALAEISIEERQSEPTPHEEPDFEPRNPYKGLRAFHEKDAHDFFGRETLIEELVEALRERLDNDRLLAVIGPSGSGKSSVVMAGLLPRLQDGALPNSAGWVYLEPMVPGARPLESLCTTLANALPEKSNAVIRQDLDDPEGRGLHLLGCQIARRADKRLVLLVDQFEELFTQTIDDDERQQFIALLIAAVSEPKGPVTVILTLRADFYDRPMEYEQLGELLEENHNIVLPMSIGDLRDVIEKPAALPDVRLRFEDGLVGDLLFAVRERVGGLPLLQFTLDQLFEHRDSHRLTLGAYHEIGGLHGALARHAEATYAGLPSDEHRQLACTLFLRLIEPGATEQDTTRRRADMSELELVDAAQTQMLREVANEFVAARLLITGELAGKATIEVSHEALIREWERLGHWLNDARDDIILQRDVSSDAAAWDERGRQSDDDLLYRGTVLAERLAWAARNNPSRNEQAFLEAAQQDEFAKLAREKRRNRFLRMAWAVFVVLLIGTLAFLFWQNEGLQAGTRKLEADKHILELRTERIVTLAEGGSFVANPFPGKSDQEIIEAVAQIAELNSWQPVITLDDFGVEMVQVPAGCFWMGSMFQQDEQPVHEVCFDEPFWIDRFEVTNEQFERLGGEIVTEDSWLRPDQPYAHITWFEAQAFCEIRGARLPTEAEWEYAARGPDSRVYPWGNEFIEYNANSTSELADVGEDQRPEGISWVGAYDMSGNVWEWTSSIYNQGLFPYPYDPNDGREVYSENPKTSHVLRGGSYGSASDLLRGAVRSRESERRTGKYGFRCARLNGS